MRNWLPETLVVCGTLCVLSSLGLGIFTAVELLARLPTVSVSGDKDILIMVMVFLSGFFMVAMCFGMVLVAAGVTRGKQREDKE